MSSELFKAFFFLSLWILFYPRKKSPSCTAIGNTVMLHLLVGPVCGHITENGSKNKPCTRGNRTRDLSVTRGVLYRCATTAPSPSQKLLIALLKKTRGLLLSLCPSIFLSYCGLLWDHKRARIFRALGLWARVFEPGLPSPGLMSPGLWAWPSSNYKFKVRNHLCYGKSTLLVPCWQFLHSLPPTRVTLRKFEQMNDVGKKDEKPFWCCHLAFLEDCLCWALILFRWSAWELSLEYDSKDVLINFVGNLGKLFPTNWN